MTSSYTMKTRKPRSHKPNTIAIDGPAASGKSTVACKLAKRRNFLYFDTGVMYRAVTWAALAHGIDLANENLVTNLAKRLRIDVKPPTVDDERQYTVMADGLDITWAIRNEDVEAGVSVVSAYPGVREALVAQQRRVSAPGGIVMVGRDIGTIVLPEADIKIYLDANIRARAMRRYQELLERSENASFDDVLSAMRRRDAIDSARKVSPLVPARDAVIIDTSELTIEQVVDEIERVIQRQTD